MEEKYLERAFVVSNQGADIMRLNAYLDLGWKVRATQQMSGNASVTTSCCLVVLSWFSKEKPKTPPK